MRRLYAVRYGRVFEVETDAVATPNGMIFLKLPHLDYKMDFDMDKDVFEYRFTAHLANLAGYVK